MTRNRRVTRIPMFGMGRSTLSTIEVKMRRHTTLAVLLASIAGTLPLQAQTGQPGWRELLESRTRTAYRYMHPESPGTCGPAHLPTVARLLAPTGEAPIGRTWLPGVNQSRWEPLNGPARPDTLEVRLVELWCGSDGHSLLVETDGYYLEVRADRLASIDAGGQIREGILIAADGVGTQLTLREECDTGTCTFRLASAEVIASDVRLATAARAEADRIRLLEADRRAESMTAAQIQTGASVGAQMDAVVDRRRMDALQRLGASDVQARAILAGRVLIGMTGSMVRGALGSPAQITRENTGGRTTAVWVYPSQTIVLSDDRVTEIR